MNHVHALAELTGYLCWTFLGAGVLVFLANRWKNRRHWLDDLEDWLREQDEEN